MVAARRRALQSELNLPPGFRFTPTDEELLIHYLAKRAASKPFAVPIIGELDLYKFDPWDLPGMALLGEKEWYFFSRRNRKYPNGSRPNRVALSGYWKATGTDKPIYSSRLKVGVKKALVFYKGRAPRGLKTNWIMHEYRLPEIANAVHPNKGSFGEDDWVLCRIYERRSNNTTQKTAKQAGKREEEEEEEESLCFHAGDEAIARPSPLDMGGLERFPAIASLIRQQQEEEGEREGEREREREGEGEYPSYFCGSSNSALLNSWRGDEFKSCQRFVEQPSPSNGFLMGLELEPFPSPFPRLESPIMHNSIYFTN